MRRLPPVVLATLVAALLLVPAPAALAASPSDAAPAVAGGSDVVVLAAEGGGELQGPEPRGPNDTENSNAPKEYEPPFLINAAVGLTALLLLLVLGLGGLYWLLVQRPKSASQG